MSLQDGNQVTPGSRDAGMPVDYDFSCCELATVDVCSGIVIGTNRGAFQRNAGKDAMGTRVAENFRPHAYVCLRGSGAAHGTCRDGSIATQLDFAAENRICAALIHDQQDEVGSFSADLESGAATFQCHHCRSAPRAVEMPPAAANHGPAAIASAEYKRGLENPREHDDAFGLIHHALRNVLGSVQDFMQDGAATFQALLFLVCRVCGECDCCHSYNEN